ncbi:MAG: hypothetical protein EBZ47_05670 [Chlamydiae bacterium]|nr:hypothetical protein [Chlamydiota bacterium]
MMWINGALIALGLVLVFAEFFMPGGVAAVLGVASMLAAVVLVGVLGPGWMAAFILFMVCVLLSALACGLAMKAIKKSARKNSFFLSTDQEGYVSCSMDPSLQGKMGVCSSDLKPAGHVEIDAVFYQAVSERGYLNKGTKIKVVEIRSSHVVVIPA